jgi:hypothetical protein
LRNPLYLSWPVPTLAKGQPEDMPCAGHPRCIHDASTTTRKHGNAKEDWNRK